LLSCPVRQPSPASTIFWRSARSCPC
jgi:hypothetical protein